MTATKVSPSAILPVNGGGNVLLPPPAGGDKRGGILRSDIFAKFYPRIREQVDTSRTNWFRVGGVAEFMFRPDDAKDLAAFLKLLPKEIPLTILGVGSNLIVRDGGIDGVIIRLGRGFTECRVESDESREKRTQHSALSTIYAGAACLDVNVAAFACKHAIEGIEFLCGIPGTIGGAVRMNGGAYGSDISEVLVEAEVVTRDGNIKTLNNKELGFSYRHSNLPEDAVVTKAVLRGRRGDQEDIAARMEEIRSARESTQPVRSRTGGSTFKNPEGYKAWQLIEQAGCRGLKIGGAQVSEQHCNFLINTGNATAADLENLGEEVRRRVMETCGIMLEWEIKRIGRHSGASRNDEVL